MKNNKLREIKRMYNYLNDNDCPPFRDDYHARDGWVTVKWHHRSGVFKIIKEYYKTKSDLTLAINLTEMQIKWVKNSDSYYSSKEDMEKDLKVNLSFSIVEDCIYDYLLNLLQQVAQKKAIEEITEKKMRQVLSGHYEALKLLKE